MNPRSGFSYWILGIAFLIFFFKLGELGMGEKGVANGEVIKSQICPQGVCFSIKWCIEGGLSSSILAGTNY